MQPSPSRRALVATHNLTSYAGSEVFTLELATELREMGWEVLVAALRQGEPMASEFEQRGFRILELLAEASLIKSIPFDLAWIQHAPVYYELLLIQGIKAAKVVFCSLSHFEPLESVPAYRGNIDLLLANSIENRNFITNELALGNDQIIVFPNSVPSNYWVTRKELHSPVLTRIAVISNHPPPEVLEAISVLKANGVAVSHIGIGGTRVLTHPKLLLEYDAIITIGKTVSCCLALKIPVYCYDHFGGPGWLDEDNFDLASQNNFSGRGFSKRTVESIVNDLFVGYSESLHSLDEFTARAARLFKLRENLQVLLNRPKVALPSSGNDFDTKQILKQHAQYISLLKAKTHLETELSALNKEISRIKSTFSWCITSPLRAAFNFIRAIFGVR